MNEFDDTTHDDSVAQLLRLAGRRPDVPEEDAATLRAAATAEWERQVRARGRRRLILGSGGMLAAAALLFLVLGPRLFHPNVPAAPVATLQRATGDVTIVPAAEDGAVLAGAVVETADARAALRLAGGHSLRLDAGTRLHLTSSTVLELDHGAVYLDSGPEPGAATVEVRTALGVAHDVGTQFEVRQPADGTLRLRVREGLVVLDRDGASHEAPAGVSLEIGADGTVTRGTVPRHGAPWDWVLETAPAFDIEGRRLPELLDWIVREGGWELRYEGPSTAEEAEAIVLHGTIEGLTPEQAAAVLLPGSGLEHRLEDGVFVVAPAGSELPVDPERR